MAVVENSQLQEKKKVNKYQVRKNNNTNGRRCRQNNSQMNPQTPPDREKVASWILYKCINIISENEYMLFVQSERDNKSAWAIKMLNDVEEVKEYVLFWIRHMDLVAKRDNSGISRVCKQLQNSLPISKKHCVFSLQDCALTGMRARPCFEIISSRDSFTPMHVHHSALEKCQSLWSLNNLDQMLAFSMRMFSERLDFGNLQEVCTELEKSELKHTLVDYFNIVFDHVHSIFRKENMFQSGVCTNQVANVKAVM